MTPWRSRQEAVGVCAGDENLGRGDSDPGDLGLVRMVEVDWSEDEIERSQLGGAIRDAYVLLARGESRPRWAKRRREIQSHGGVRPARTFTRSAGFPFHPPRRDAPMTPPTNDIEMTPRRLTDHRYGLAQPSDSV
ncbi:unnamed protein product, partial [Iphiclides podalirius]